MVGPEKQVSHPQVGENRTALFPVLVLFWCVGGGRGATSVHYSMSGAEMVDGEGSGEINIER